MTRSYHSKKRLDSHTHNESLKAKKAPVKFTLHVPIKTKAWATHEKA